MTARDIPGWNSDITPWARWIAPRIPPGGTYLEIGAFLGASLATMGELRPDISLIAVDPWIAEPSAGPDGWRGLGIFAPHVAVYGDLFLAFLGEMTKHAPDVLRRTRVIRGSARDVVLSTPVDMLFIDGAHDYDSVALDLCVFGPLVKKGGIISGHDYTPDFNGVSEAVDEYLGRKPNLGIAGEGVCWWAVV